MNGERSILIIGGGLAGARAAEGARAAGYDGLVRLVAAEDEMPYIRPPLSKEFLNGGGSRDDLDVHPAEWYPEHRVDVLRGIRATALDVGGHRVRLDDGRDLGYDRLLLATGSEPRRWPGAGADLAGVHTLRTVGDSVALRELLSPGGRRIALIGSGWIGLEVAAAARGYGNDVTVVAPDAVPLEGAIGRAAGEVFARLHRDHGVDLRMSTKVHGIAGDDGRATGVALEGGEVVPADAVIVAIGASPATALAEAAGIEVDDGVMTDAAFRTSAEDVFAVGDVANVYQPFLGRHLRTEHWATAEHHGPAAGRSMAGEHVEFDEPPYFYTDQYDLGMEFSGYGPLMAGVEPVFRGDVPGREFIAFWLADDRVVAGMNVNVWDVNEQVQQLIRSRARIDGARIVDPAVPLERLVAEATA
ncbi:3-phenylpropionate/trans-cinnamate dioxygenase ferredoxin reductase subunit [Agromyces sp. 3263]|uniref:NAD(P)/FAD-dependent oxidoreductase n=1 Tax=Agromyces sp. 3263 TaxID=2817750 RepID=UPI002865A73D|nr:FAD-dependent oxidoreductase [Agromyces sp. 3263]MDR6906871.1 3-phenylpropionate/trans-cinnamate dioxygenase ferredoxin reductase subunit [Agromyces sp. 3263]